MKYCFRHPFHFAFLALSGKNMLNWMPDKMYLKMRYRVKLQQKLNLKNPQTYNEKLQWLKLYDHRPEYVAMVDKYEMKSYVAKRLGEEYLFATIGVWDKFDEIDFESLPNQFVLKCTHDSGGLVICRDKSRLDKEAARKKIERCLKRNYYWLGREWPYKGVRPRIIAEEYMEDAKTKELRDYKFFCFDGEVKAMFVATERADQTTETKFDFFDTQYNHLPVVQGHPNATVPPAKPEQFEEMKVLAAKLSKGFPHVRVDFYEVNGRIYVGELTLFHFSGLVPFVPAEWDKTFGDWITLPEKRI